MADNSSSCGESIPYSYEIIGEATIGQKVMLIVVPILTAITCILFLESVHFMKKSIPSKIRRNRMIWLLGIYPAFSVTSCVGLFVPRSAMLTNFVASIYLSLTLYTFLMLVIDYYGGSDAMHHTLQDRPVSINTFPILLCCVCLPKIKITEHSSPWIKRLVLQNALIRPTILFVAVVLWVDGRYHPGMVGADEPFVWLIIISVTSTITAMQAIGIIHGASKVPLRDYKISFKFMTIQLTLLFGNIQLGLLTIISNFGAIPCKDPFDNTARVYNIYNVLVVCEFFCIGIASRLLFRTPHNGNTHNATKSLDSKDLEAGEKPIQYTVKDSSVTDNNENMGSVNGSYNHSETKQ